MLTNLQRDNLVKQNKSVEQAIRNLQQIRNGIPKVSGIIPATLANKGVKQLTAENQNDAIRHFNKMNPATKWVKFIPASGVASRMFTDVYEYLDFSKDTKSNLDNYLKSKPSFNYLIQNLDQLPFFQSIDDRLKQSKNLISDESTDTYFEDFFDILVNDHKFGFSHLPKGLIPFFNQTNQVFTPFEAHILESHELFQSLDTIELHLTIDEYFIDHFEKIRLQIANHINQKIRVSYSFQDPSTDTPILSIEGDWLKDDQDNLLFRKGGHGALLDNLNNVESDFVLIKNIDNILMGKKNQEVVYWLKVICGSLQNIKHEIDSCLSDLYATNNKNSIHNASELIRKYFDSDFRLGNYLDVIKEEFLIQYLDRPLRICAMVKAQGATGGGPYWQVINNRLSREIFEEIEIRESKNVEETEKSTHFNPVMIACALKNRNGEKYDIKRFVNEDRYMIVHKTIGSKKIRAIEWPGLWNGGMSKWNTLFFEVPNLIFNPVKRIQDLIRHP